MQSEKHTKSQLKGGISLKNVQNEKPGEAETRRKYKLQDTKYKTQNTKQGSRSCFCRLLVAFSGCHY